MVNAAFTYNEINARAMETALNLLRSMADRGNSYLESRHSLLLELRAAIGPKMVTDHLNCLDTALNAPATPESNDLAGVLSETASQNPSMLPGNWEELSDLPSLQDISFQIDLSDDPALWEGALDQIDIDMDTDWIENTLKR